MNGKKILVIGYFGYKSNQLDGQTIKTRNVYKLIKLKKMIYVYLIILIRNHSKNRNYTFYI